MSWLLRGLLIGAAIAIAGVAIAGTGGLAAAAIIGASAAAGAGLGELFSTMSWAPKETCGLIADACSSNVFTNGLRAARAHVDVAQCAKHSMPHPPIATGSATVFINGSPAARIDDSIACGAVITGGSHNVFVGGGVVQTDPTQPEDLVPGWVHTALLAIGLGAAMVLSGPIVAATGTFCGLLGGEVGGRIGERILWLRKRRTEVVDACGFAGRWIFRCKRNTPWIQFLRRAHHSRYERWKYKACTKI